LFIVAGGFHLYYNWKPLIRYLTGKIETALRHKRELAISSLIFVWIVVSGIWALPPLSYVTDLGETIKNAWVDSPELEPPFGHAELVSLKTFCRKQRIPLDKAMSQLRKAGFAVTSPNDTLVKIADSRGTSGMAVYRVIKKLEPEPSAVKPEAGWTPEKIEETFAGTGVGRRTVGDIIKEHGLDREAAFRRLKERGIKAGDDQKLKELADEHDATSIEILTVILKEKK
jgi:hypothetical protein